MSNIKYFYGRQSHHIFPYDQQQVSDIPHFVTVSSHLFPWPTACEWHRIWSKCSLITPFLWQIASEWYFVRGSLVTSVFLWQQVSDIAQWVKCSNITSFPMTNSLLVTSHILQKGILISFFSMIDSKWVAFTFCECQSHHIFCYNNSMWVTLLLLWKVVSSHLLHDEQLVSDLPDFVKGYLPISFFPMTNSKWVTLHIVWK